MTNKGITIVFGWIPSHIGIKGNEKADHYAKTSLDLNITNTPIPYHDFKPLIRSYIHNNWQTLWEKQTENKLYKISPNIADSSTPIFKTRKEEIIFSRLKIGHSRLTHEYLLKRDAPPFCTKCNCAITINHVLLVCDKYTQFRPFGQCVDIQNLFGSFEPKQIIQFLRDVDVFNKL